MKRVTLIGDCIRQDYQPTVRDELADVAEVWGPKETIKTTRDVLAHLDKWVLRPRPDLFHFNCGLHEIRRFRPGDPQTVPLPEFRRNLDQIFLRIREGSETAITWAHTTPIFHERRDRINTYGRLDSDVREYNAAASEVAAGYGVRIVDLHRRTHESGMARYMARNGLHFTPEGYVMLGKAVAQAIRQELHVGVDSPTETAYAK
ncbi:MAG: GDSL-type esterase/lipase family protein [Chloroflexi bacterium]|nr:GDSL-type esterase/lipase family protein [Chloroflexota bacterium]